MRDTSLGAATRVGAHDAIVVGAGATGALAASLLVAGGLRVLLLDAGPARWMSAIGRATLSLGQLFFGNAALESHARHRQPVQSLCYAWDSAPQGFVDDREHPYVTPPDRPFVWLRSRQMGGRLAIPDHGRQYYRMGPEIFAPGDGTRPCWPFDAGELDPWYGQVEAKLQLSGARENIPWLPDSELAEELEPNPLEAALQERLAARWPNARAALGRYADPTNVLGELESAARTGRLSVRQGAVARRVEVDREGRASGVEWIDQGSRSGVRSSAPLVFLCASALESTRILLLSRMNAAGDRRSRASGALGRYLMDHVRVTMRGWVKAPPPEAAPEAGRCLYLPRFDARARKGPSTLPGFGVQVYQHPSRSRARVSLSATSFGEMLPDPQNRITLDARTDALGIPVLRIACRHGPSELDVARRQRAALRELADAVGITITHMDAHPSPPGSANHECGTARMGVDPRTSVLDPFNQSWETPGLYLTDGAAFPSQGTQNPTLTLLALTARACAHALRSEPGSMCGSVRPATVPSA